MLALLFSGCHSEPEPKANRVETEAPKVRCSTPDPAFRGMPMHVDFPDKPTVPEAIRGPSPPIEPAKNEPTKTDAK